MSDVEWWKTWEAAADEAEKPRLANNEQDMAALENIRKLNAQWDDSEIGRQTQITWREFAERYSLIGGSYIICGMNTMTDMASDDLPEAAIPEALPAWEVEVRLNADRAATAMGESWNSEPGESAPPSSPEGAVQNHIDLVIDHLIGGRTTAEQRRGLKSATERADRVMPESDAAVGRALR